MKRTLTLLVVAPLALWSVSCKKAEAPKPAPAATAAAVPANAPPGVPGAPPVLKPMPPQIPDVLARVNGEKIERWEFDNAVKRMEARAGGPVPPDKRDEVLRGVLDQLVAYHLLAQESRARKLAVADTDVDARLAEIRKSFPTEEAFKQGIAAQGLTLEQLKSQAKTSLEVAKVIETEVNSKVAVQDPEVKTFYDQNLERFKQGDTVHAAHILIGLPQNATPEQKAEAKTKAAAVLKTVKAGGDFATLARANSSDHGQRAERRRSRVLPEGSDDAGVRGGGVQAEAGHGQRAGRDAVRLSHHQGDRAPRAADGAVRRGVGTDQGLPDAGPARTEARAVRRTGQGEGEDRDTRLN